jgi:hypothetical protein
LRLLDPDIGEIADRQSILQLKIDAGMKKGVSTLAWEDELLQLDTYLGKKIQSWQRVATAGSTDDFGKLNAELSQVNARLWQSEDEIRRLRTAAIRSIGSTDGPAISEIGALALRICDLNDARCNLVHRINAIFGVNQQEKIYA